MRYCGLIVLAAQYARMHGIYPDIGYSLIPKEVGAVFQAAMMAAAAMGLSTCPLGCGNTLLFSELAGVSSLVESSVGELMLGSREESVWDVCVLRRPTQHRFRSGLISRVGSPRIYDPSASTGGLVVPAIRPSVLPSSEASISSKALACLKSSVSKPSVNQPRFAARLFRPCCRLP